MDEAEQLKKVRFDLTEDGFGADRLGVIAFGMFPSDETL